MYLLPANPELGIRGGAARQVSVKKVKWFYNITNSDSFSDFTPNPLRRQSLLVRCALNLCHLIASL